MTVFVTRTSILKLAITSVSLLIFMTAGWTRELSPTPKQQAARRFKDRQSLAGEPTVLYTAHSQGNIRLAVANNGTLGTEGQVIIDPFSGDPLPSCEYPRGSDVVFLWVGAIWVGAIVNNDTLVSTGTEDFYQTTELWPDLPELGGEFKYGSIDVNSKYYSTGVEAYSEEDILAEYYDTETAPSRVGFDPTDGRGHIPLGIKIEQRTMAWSYEYADDFILFDFKIKNIGTDRLRKVYIGIWVDGDVWHSSRNSPEGWNDDIVGFYPTHPAPEGCGFIDTVNIAWHADNDGDGMPRENPSAWDYRSTTGVVGTRVVRTPSDSLQYSYNWWIIDYQDASQDFGPRKRGTVESPFRNMGSRLGTPEGDKNKYYLLSHPEFDYDLMSTAQDHSGEGWLQPPLRADSYATGYDCRYLLSFGPFDIEPGQALPVTFAWVGGEDFHQAPGDMFQYFDPNNPEVYYDRLNFDNLATNARWASWVYDNPGVDTDGDGYRGKARICGLADTTSQDTTSADSIWYEGDGIPDFRGAGPPPAPRLRVISSMGKLTVRFNGFYSETTHDIFTGRVDFEGYRIYSALDDRPSSYSLVRSYDRENFTRYTWGLENNVETWIQDEFPHSRAALRQMYDDPDFDPENYTRTDPYRAQPPIAYFEPQDFNQFSLVEPDGIRKVYPDAPNPGTDSTKWLEDELVFDYGEPLPKYYEYEYVLENLLPTIPYNVAVTAFDYGSPKSGLASLEGKPENNSIEEFPQPSSETVVEDQLDVYIIPNPYRLDGAYLQRGFENRVREGKDEERTRRIHFFNLPAVCTISIYSIDGDMIRQLEHNFPEGGPSSMHHTWDMITRNSQSVVSGLYYWVVEGDGRNQIGRLAVIK